MFFKGVTVFLVDDVTNDKSHQIRLNATVRFTILIFVVFRSFSLPKTFKRLLNSETHEKDVLSFVHSF